MNTPAKPESAFKKSVRAVELGLALGVAGFILNALIGGEIAGLMLRSEEDFAVLPFVMSALPAVIAPGLAFAVGLVVEGARWKIVVSQNLTLQFATALVPAVSVGMDEYLTFWTVAQGIGLFAVGTVLSGLAMGRAQRRSRSPQPSTTPTNLAAIDFEKVKQEAAAAAVQAGPLPAASAAADPSAPTPATPAPEAASTASTSSTAPTASMAPAAPAPAAASPAEAGPSPAAPADGGKPNP